MPNSCNETSEELNDDLLEFQNLIDGLSSTVNTNFNKALAAWEKRAEDAREVDSEYQGYLNEISTIETEIANRNDLISQKDIDAAQYEAEAATHRANQAEAEANGDTELAATHQQNAETVEGYAENLRNQINVLNDEIALLETNKSVAENNEQTRYAEIQADTKNLDIPDGTSREDIENYSYSQAITLSNQEYNAAKDALLEDSQFADTVRDSADRAEDSVPVGAPEV